MHLFIRSALTFAAVFSLSLSSVFAKPEARDFNQLSAENKEDLAYIIKSLGSKSLVSIGFSKKKICKAGARVHVVHPLRYVLHILNDKELTFNLCAMKDRSWIWDGYLHGEHGDDGFLDSLQQEFDAGGIHKEHVRKLANKIGVSYDYVQQLTDTCQWDRIIQLIMHYAVGKVRFNPYNDV